MLRSTTISIRSAISSPAKFTSRDALRHWPSGAPSRPNGRVDLGVLRHAQATGRYYDKAVLRQMFPVDAGNDPETLRLHTLKIGAELRDQAAARSDPAAPSITVTLDST